MSFQRLSERVQGKCRPPESRWRSRGPDVFGPVQLLQLAAVFFAVHCGTLTVLPGTSWLNLKGKEIRAGKGMGETWVER